MKTLIVGLHKDGKLIATTYELIEAARAMGGEVITAVLADDAQATAADLTSRGGGKVLAVSNERLRHFNDEVYAKVLVELIRKHTPEVVLGPATFYGKALFGRLAALLEAPMVSDITGVALREGQVVCSRPHYGGSVMSSLVKNGDGPFLATVRPKVFAESKEGPGEVAAESVDSSAFDSNMVVKETKSEGSGAVSLTEADIIVSAGRGLKGADNLGMVEELAKTLHGAFGASRAIVDAGWSAYSNQVGQTGKTVNPKLYIAVGISGAIQHIVGMRTSGTIVAINKDKDAPIFNIANYGIVGDAFEVVPALTKKLKAELG